MKKINFLFILMFAGLSAYAQTPQSFQYQAVVRDAGGNPVLSQPVGVQLSILQGSVSGSSVYTETHSVSTNAFGILNLNVGGGIIQSGDFSLIDWSAGPYFLKMEIDHAGGISYVDMGAVQLLSVPYALYSKTSEDAFSGNYLDLTNTPDFTGWDQNASNDFSGNYNDLTGVPTNVSAFNNDAGYITSPNDADADASNELQILSISGNDLTISDGNTVALPQTTYTAGTGIDITSGTITNTIPDQTVTISGSGATTVTGTYPNFSVSSTDNNTTYTAGSGLSLTGTEFANTAPDQTVSITGTGATTVTGTYPSFTISSTDNVNDADADATNELQIISLTGNDLSISDGNTVTLPIGTTNPAGVNGDIQFNNSGAFGANNSLVWDNVNERMGVGLNNPNGRLIVQRSATAPPEEPLFEVKDDDGQTVFVVYKDSVRVFVDDDPAKTNKGAFAVSGRNTVKAFTNNFLWVSPDSSRVYTGDPVKGFGVKNINGSAKESYMQLTPNNYFIGHEAGRSITTGLYNSFIGYQAGYSDTSGYKNYFLGYYAGYNNRNGYSNIFIGDNCGYNNNTGFRNVFLGDHCGFSNASGKNNVFLGYYTGYNNDADYNVFLGYQTGYTNTSGWGNVACGYMALYSNTSGFNNVANGYQALNYNEDGGYNVALGYQALYNNISGNYNVANGYQALFFNDADYNTANGYNALLYNSTGNSNTADGMQALLYNTTGYYNTAAGFASLASNTTGYASSACGSNALYSNTTGFYNTAAGSRSLYSNTTGSYCSAFGYAAFESGTDTNSTALGALTSITANNQVRLGNAGVISIGGFADWTNVSDKRFKKDIKANVPGLDFIMKLEPVTYYLDMDKIAEYLHTPDSVRLRNSEKTKGEMLQTGFLAQDVEKAANDLGFEFSGIDKPQNENDFYGLRYAEFTVPMVKAIQEQQVIIQNQQKQIDELKNEIQILNDRLSKIEKK